MDPGEFTDSEIIVMLGENGTGKTTFIRMLHGTLKPDDEGVEVPQFRVSYKPQKISPKFPGTVRQWLAFYAPSWVAAGLLHHQMKALPGKYTDRSAAMQCNQRTSTIVDPCLTGQLPGHSLSWIPSILLTLLLRLLHASLKSWACVTAAALLASKCC